MADFVLDEYKNLNKVNIPLPSSVYIQCEPDKYVGHIAANTNGNDADYYSVSYNSFYNDNYSISPVKNLEVNNFTGIFGAAGVSIYSSNSSKTIEVTFPSEGIYTGIFYIRLTRYNNSNAGLTSLSFRYNSLPSFQFSNNQFSALNNSYNNPEVRNFYDWGNISGITTVTSKTVSLTTPRSFTSSDNWTYTYNKTVDNQEFQIYYCYAFIRLA